VATEASKSRYRILLAFSGTSSCPLGLQTRVTGFTTTLPQPRVAPCSSPSGEVACSKAQFCRPLSLSVGSRT
jgi:hypothetical protein